MAHMNIQQFGEGGAPSSRRFWLWVGAACLTALTVLMIVFGDACAESSICMVVPSYFVMFVAFLLVTLELTIVAVRKYLRAIDFS